MPQEITPEDNSDENPTDSAQPASAQQIAAGDNAGETATEELTASAQQKVRITIVGSRKAVLKTIHALYLLGFAEVSDWVRFVVSESR